MLLKSLLPGGAYRRLRDAWRTLMVPVRGRMRRERDDAALCLPLGFRASSPAPRIAVICHLFHAELADEFRGVMDNLPAPADLFLSTDDAAKRPAIDAAFAGWSKGAVDVRVFPNRGRDIAPKLAGFADAYADHDLVLFVHSKKSLTSALGDRWRRALLRTLAGSPRAVSDILYLFDAYPRLGIVMAQHFRPIRNLVHWDGNFRAAARLAQRTGLALTRRRTLDFPSGSMFWARPAALRPLLDLRLGFDDFPAEADQRRGTVQHAVERLFLLLAEHAGFRWIKVTRPEGDGEDGLAVAVSDRRELDAFMVRHRFDLLPLHER